MTKWLGGLGYWVLGVIVSYIVIVPAWIARGLGRIRVHWSSEAFAAWESGGVLLVSNHPTLIETAVLPSLFWRPAWLGSTTKIPWSLADQYLFGDRPWLYPFLRCLRVSRIAGKDSRRLNCKAVKGALKILGQKGVIINYLEGGRTSKGDIRHSVPGRRLRQCDIGLVKLASRRGYSIVPVWVEHGEVSQPESFLHGYKKLFFGPKMEIYFGQPLSRDTKEINEKTVALAILNAGI